MDWTDRHCRFFHRLLAPSARLYTEMVTTGAVIHGDRGYLLGFDRSEKPLALQLGGSDPEALAQAAAIGEGYGYDEINLNVGCPSDRVQQGRFGVCLMREPGLVRDCLTAMAESVSVPVTIKTRIGVDEHDSEAFFLDFVDQVTEGSGVDTVIIHARKAWLKGLSPKENREVPDLNYERVYALAKHRPELKVVINGGLVSVEDCRPHTTQLSGVMLGRAAYQTPWVLAEMTAALGGAAPATRGEVVQQMLAYLDSHLLHGGKFSQVARHMLGLYRGCPGGRRWRQVLSQGMHKPDASVALMIDACPDRLVS